jgi:hypothetical protein
MADAGQQEKASKKEAPDGTGYRAAGYGAWAVSSFVHVATLGTGRGLSHEP